MPLNEPQSLLQGMMAGARFDEQKQAANLASTQAVNLQNLMHAHRTEEQMTEVPASALHPSLHAGLTPGETPGMFKVRASVLPTLEKATESLVGRENRAKQATSLARTIRENAPPGEGGNAHRHFAANLQGLAESGDVDPKILESANQFQNPEGVVVGPGARLLNKRSGEQLGPASGAVEPTQPPAAASDGHAWKRTWDAQTGKWTWTEHPLTGNDYFRLAQEAHQKGDIPNRDRHLALANYARTVPWTEGGGVIGAGNLALGVAPGGGSGRGLAPTDLGVGTTPAAGPTIAPGSMTGPTKPPLGKQVDEIISADSSLHLLGSLANGLKDPDVLTLDLQRRGLRCLVDARPKEVASLLKKVLRKSYSAPYEEIHDKAGVRVIATFADDVPLVEEIVRSRLEVQRYENKTLGLDYHELGYLGVHFDVSLRDVDVVRPEWRALIAEIQIHTRAQNCWADVSHRLLYKPAQETPVEIKRRVYRLMALIELFDETAQEARKAMEMLPGAPQAGVLAELEQHFYQFAARPYDRELSLDIIDALAGLYDASEREQFGELMQQFVERNRQKLDELFGAYRDDERCNPLIFQPEALMVYERLERDAFRLRESWIASFPLPLLENLAGVWGRAL